MSGTTPRPEPREAARRLWSERFSAAQVLFCAGSVVRGEGLPSSDLDVVVLFDRVANAWRESFRFEGWPVEVFAHDAETLAYFVAEDCRQGRPALAQMISEALVLPAPTSLSEAIQRWAKEVLASRPALPAPAVLADDRYAISDLLDDLRDDRAPAELRAVACRLYPLVCNFVLKTRGHWLGSGKSLPRFVERADPSASARIETAFEAFFRAGERSGMLRAIQDILEPFGGELFAGFRSDAPATHRIAGVEAPWHRQWREANAP